MWCSLLSFHDPQPGPDQLYMYIYTLFGLFPSGVEYPGRKMTNFFVFFVGILISDRGFHSYNEKLLVMLLWFYYARKLFPCFYFPFWFLFIFIFILSFSLSFFSLRLHFHSLYLMIYTLKMIRYSIPVLLSFLLLCLALILLRACRSI